MVKINCRARMNRYHPSCTKKVKGSKTYTFRDYPRIGKTSTVKIRAKTKAEAIKKASRIARTTPKEFRKALKKTIRKERRGPEAVRLVSVR